MFVLEMGDLKSKPMLLSGTSNRILPDPVPNSHILSPIKALEVMDPVEGAQSNLKAETLSFFIH